MHGDEKFRALSRPPPNAQTLWVHLLTGPSTSSVPGLFCAGKAQLAEELGWTVDDFDGCWAEVEAAGMAQADWGARLVWLPNAMPHNEPSNPNQVKGWVRIIKTFPDSPLLSDAVARMTLLLDIIDDSRDDVAAAKEKSKPKQRYAELFRNGFETVSKRFRNGMPNGFETVCQTVSNTEAVTVTEAEAEAVISDPNKSDMVTSSQELEAVGTRKGLRPLVKHDLDAVARILPCTPGEFDAAWTITKAQAAKPGWGYLATCIESARKKPPPPKRDLKHGHSEPSTSFDSNEKF